MKKHLLFTTILVALATVFSMTLIAQDDEEPEADYIELIPADLDPHPEGFYIKGGYADPDKDGVLDWFNGCSDEYTDTNHNETGEQQGFKYLNCCIKPTCTPNAEEFDVDVGYIGIRRNKFTGTDSAIHSWIMTMPMTNLEEIEIQISPENTPNWHVGAYRNVYIQYSDDYGKTFDTVNYINVNCPDGADGKAGAEFTYNADEPDEYQAINTIIAASNQGPIVLRMITPDREIHPPRIRIHYFMAYAVEGSWEDTISVDISENTIQIQPIVNVFENQIQAINGSIAVYNLIGKLMGSGTSVIVPRGIYIVKGDNGRTEKVYVK